MRTLWCGLLLCAVMAAPAAAQDEDTRPALPSIYGDTGLWTLPTAEVARKGKVTGSLFLMNEHRPQGVTRLNMFGPTIGFGIADRVELFGSYRAGAVERDLRPIFIPGHVYGGIQHDVPFVDRGWTGIKAGPTFLGAKVNFLSQSRQDPLALAFRAIIKAPTGSKLIQDGKPNAMFDLIVSGEGGGVEITGSGGYIWRKEPDEFMTANSTTFGFGLSFPSRSRLRGLFEATAEIVDNGITIAQTPGVPTGLDGSLRPNISTVDDVGLLRAGLVWQAKNGWFIHGGMSYTLSYASDDIGSRDEPGSPWGYDVRIGFHPGTKKYVPPPPPPPPAPVAAAPPPPAPAPPPNRNPQVTIVCNPCTVEVGKPLSLSATPSDPDNDATTLRWSAPSGTFNPQTGASTTWTAPGQEGTVPLTATVTDARGGTGTATVQAQVTRPPQKTFMFEDVHFDFDKYNLKPEALKILDQAVTTLQQNPEVRLTIEGHCVLAGLDVGERLWLQRHRSVAQERVGAAPLRRGSSTPTPTRSARWAMASR